MTQKEYIKTHPEQFKDDIDKLLYIKTHPEQFKDDIDKWLFTEFGIIGGRRSADEYCVKRLEDGYNDILKEEERG